VSALADTSIPHQTAGTGGHLWEAVCGYRSDEDEILTGLITAHEHRPHPAVLDGGGRCDVAGRAQGGGNPEDAPAFSGPGAPATQ